jgi:hypothetical protein
MSTFLKYGGNLDHAVSYMYLELLKKRAKRVSGFVAPDKVAANKKALDAKIALIRATPNDSEWVTAERHAELLEEQVAAERVRFTARGDAVAAEVEEDPHGAILAQLEIEKAILKKIMEDLAAADKRGEAPKYGKPLESGNKARYRFWPLHKAQMPLFFEVAWVLLCIPATSTNNERGHSVSGRICDKLRGALKPATVERLTLSWYFFPVTIKKIADSFAAQLKVLDANKMDLADVDAMLADEPPPLDIE